MSKGKNIIAIDAGNTQIKVAQFKDSNLYNVSRFNNDDYPAIRNYISDLQPEFIIYSSVLNNEMTEQIVSMHSNLYEISTTIRLPFKINYATPETLGVDRLCNAAYVHNTLSTEIGVCLDIGTCIKFDVISKKDGYIGGSISPGINLRFKALNAFTGKLPLISNNSRTDLVGTNTDTSIRSGVINGMNAEIQGMINSYEKRFKDLTFFVTGGDASVFDIHSKNDIFADENLTLKGMIEIYNYNA